jgi:hypothetical protein
VEEGDGPRALLGDDPGFFEEEESPMVELSQKLSSWGSSMKNFWRKMPTAIRGEEPGGEEFLCRLRKKARAQILQSKFPDFHKGTMMEIIERARQDRQLIFFYVQDHKSPMSRDIEETMLTDEQVLEFVKEMIPFGLNIHTSHGKQVCSQLSVGAVPHISILRIDQESKVRIQSVLEGKDIKAESLVKELEHCLSKHRAEREEEKKEEELKENELLSEQLA